MRIGSNTASLIWQMNTRRTYTPGQMAAIAARASAAKSAQVDRPADMIARETMRSDLVDLFVQTAAGERAYNQAAVAEGAMGQVSSLLVEASGLAIANADSTLSAAEKAGNQLQLDSVLSSIERIGRTTSFAGQRLLDGSSSLRFGTTSLPLPAIASDKLGRTATAEGEKALADVASGQSLVTTGLNVADAQRVINSAMREINEQRGKIGAFQQGAVDRTMRVTQVAAEQLTAAMALTGEAGVGAAVDVLA